MAHPDRDRWDRRYRQKRLPEKLEPPEWLCECLPLLPPGRALDVACGEGHAAVTLAQRGWAVYAMDISLEALRRARYLAQRYQCEVQLLLADASQYPLPTNYFSVITVFSYLDRIHLPRQICQSLVQGGVLVYETYTQEAANTPGLGIRNPDYLLRANELLDLYRTLRVLRFRDLTPLQRPVQSLLAMRGS
jgi:tellurite methyltransferase